MSTTIKSHRGHFLELSTTTATDEHTVSVRMETSASDGVGYVQRSFLPAEFLAAVATELDVIVIPRADLPKVTESGGRLVVDGIEGIKFPTDADYHARALENLALDEHLKTHPPVDPAQVDALADLIATEALMPTGLSYNDVARRLIATGRVTVTGAGK